jgi:alkane 1-monooxygenase
MPSNEPQVSDRPLTPLKTTTASNDKPFVLFAAFPYYLPTLLHVTAYLILRYTGNPFYLVWLIVGLLPFLDHYVQFDWINPTHTQYKLLEKDWRFELPLYVLAIADWVLEFWVINWLCTHPVSLTETIVTILMMGSITGILFQVAHELYHKQERIPRVFGTLIMVKHLYMHSFISHTWGHHKNVATPLDPGYAPLGESIYGFLAHCLPGNLKDAWRYETKRLSIKGHSNPWVAGNRILWFMACNTMMICLVVLIFGGYGTLMFLLIGFWAVCNLEAVNYLEHYGLTRKEISPGVYEKVGKAHSWNAARRVMNYLLFKVERHSDHHENAYKPYHTLQVEEDSPILSCGYLLGSISTFTPWQWFKMTDPLVIALNKGVKLTSEEAKKNLADVTQIVWSNFILTSVVLLFSVYYKSL